MKFYTPYLYIAPGYYTRERLRANPPHWTPLLRARKRTEPAVHVTKRADTPVFKLDLPEFLTRRRTNAQSTP